MTYAVFNLALNIYHESRGEPLEGWKGVCKVVLNRCQQLGKTVVQVIYASKQFSWTEDTLPDYPKDTETFYECLRVAEEAIDEFINGDNLQGADHYHSVDVDPYWNEDMTIIGTIGRHIFYRS